MFDVDIIAGSWPHVVTSNRSYAYQRQTENTETYNELTSLKLNYAAELNKKTAESSGHQDINETITNWSAAIMKKHWAANETCMLFILP